ncbi:hypothetical protein NDU88_001875 [Pleurodeles waltl]|uniref:Uncharacterized protein n=1 Tax=Pleurodeles waltl TaxID=8319 RepID=A0AAV7SCT4_PLEWA|nr:hypothetical protein NDU88_001875 [Pleurodeles waltl]
MQCAESRFRGGPLDGERECPIPSAHTGRSWRPEARCRAAASRTFPAWRGTAARRERLGRDFERYALRGNPAEGSPPMPMSSPLPTSQRNPSPLTELLWGTNVCCAQKERPLTLDFRLSATVEPRRRVGRDLPLERRDPSWTVRSPPGVSDLSPGSGEPSLPPHTTPLNALNIKGSGGSLVLSGRRKGATSLLDPLPHATCTLNPAMPAGRSSNKHSGKPARQLLFSEALQHSQTFPPASKVHPPGQPCTMTDHVQETTMDRILQEISAVGRRLEGMDSMMASLMEETKSMHLDIAGFQTRVTSLKQRVTAVEAQAVSATDRDQELLYLHSKLIDLENRSGRDNVRFLGFPENIEGAHFQSLLKETIPKLTGLTFDPP